MKEPFVWFFYTGSHPVILSLCQHRKKIAKFLMSTFTCRSTFLYGRNKSPAYVMHVCIYVCLQHIHNKEHSKNKLNVGANSPSEINASYFTKLKKFPYSTTTFKNIFYLSPANPRRSWMRRRRSGNAWRPRPRSSG